MIFFHIGASSAGGHAPSNLNACLCVYNEMDRKSDCTEIGNLEFSPILNNSKFACRIFSVFSWVLLSPKHNESKLKLQPNSRLPRFLYLQNDFNYLQRFTQNKVTIYVIPIHTGFSESKNRLDIEHTFHFTVTSTAIWNSVILFAVSQESDLTIEYSHESIVQNQFIFCLK